jgi:hypothetical protein
MLDAEAEKTARVLGDCFAEASSGVFGEDSPVQVRSRTHTIC